MLGTGELERSVGVICGLVTGVWYRFVDQVVKKNSAG